MAASREQRPEDDSGTVLCFSPYPWDCAALQVRRSIVLRPWVLSARPLHGPALIRGTGAAMRCPNVALRLSIFAAAALSLAAWRERFHAAKEK
jgi:hypothetical protein